MKILKYFLLLFVVVASQSIAQTKSTKKTRIKRPDIIAPPEIVIPEKYKTSENVPLFPLAFAWQINADTTLAPNVIFREIIELNGDQVDSRVSFRDVEVKLKKSEQENYNVQNDVLSMFVKLVQYDAKIDQNMLYLTDRKNKILRTFKIFYDQHNHIERLQDLNTKKFYESTPFEGASPSM